MGRGKPTPRGHLIGCPVIVSLEYSHESPTLGRASRFASCDASRAGSSRFCLRKMVRNETEVALMGQMLRSIGNQFGRRDLNVPVWYRGRGPRSNVDRFNSQTRLCVTIPPMFHGDCSSLDNGRFPRIPPGWTSKSNCHPSSCVLPKEHRVRLSSKHLCPRVNVE